MALQAQLASRYPHITIEIDKTESNFPRCTKCSICRKITVESLCSEEGFQHAKTGEELQRVRFCRLCGSLWRAEDIALMIDELEETKGTTLGIRLKLEKSNGGSVLRAYLNGKRTCNVFVGCEFLTHVTVIQEDIAAEFNITSESDRNFSGSQFHANRAKAWIHECYSFHNCTNETRTLDKLSKTWKERWPRRLIYISEQPKSSRLVEVSDIEEMQPPYATLSHCWGPSGLANSAKTTTESFVDRTSGIDIETLPKTFQDAISFTRRLGLLYLWIDALCIIQGSRTDWEEEGAKMGTIYSSATVMLAAESSLDSHSGLFTHTTDPDANSPESIEIPQTLSDGRNSTLIFRSSDSRCLKSDNIKLQKRAWTLQERVLSPRILHFFDVGILWECQRHYEIWHNPTANVPWYCISHIGAQFGKEIAFSSRDQFVNHQKEQILMESYGYSTLDELEDVRKIIQEHPYNLPRWTLFRPWFRYIIPSYTTRALTFQSDKLPAISSIARAFQRQTGSTYLSGLWDEDIAFGLTWVPISVRNSKTERHDLTQKAGPSWSWASQNLPCTWNIYQKDAQYWSMGITASSLKSYITLQSHQIDIHGSDPFGQVTGGRLQIRGKVLLGDVISRAPSESHFPPAEVILFRKRSNGTTQVRQWKSVQPSGDSRSYISLPLNEVQIKSEGDREGDQPSSACLLLCSAEGIEYFLALNKVREPNVFERRCLFSCNFERGLVREIDEDTLQWLEKGDEKELVLV